MTLISQTFGHADLKTTSVYAHAKPGDSSSRVLEEVSMVSKKREPIVWGYQRRRPDDERGAPTSPAAVG